MEATLISADLGTTTTHEILQKLRDKADRKQIKDVDELKRLLKEEILAILNSTAARPVTKVDGTPEVILVVGVNGTGKTTTIGKLSQVFRSQGKTVLLAQPTPSAPPPSSNSKSGAAHRHRSDQDQSRRRSVRRTLRRLAVRDRPQDDYVIVDTAGRLHTKRI